jgi:ribose-phosphate pyrophosphokinase
MPASPFVLFALEASRSYAERVAAHLDLALARHEEHDFEDGEHKVRPLDPVRGREAVVIHSLYGEPGQSGHDKLCRMLFFCAALKDAGARRVTALVPYLCYARKDRRTHPQDPITIRYVAGMFEACGVDAVSTVEVHNLAAFENAFRLPTQHIATAPLLAQHFAGMRGAEEIVVVSPDAGGAKRAEDFRRALEQGLGRPVGSALMEKFRSGGVVTGTLLAGVVAGRTAIIVDDLISTGGTLQRAARACRDGGATRIFAAAAHGLFMPGAEELLRDPSFERIVILDTVPPFRVAPDLVANRLTILDSTKVVAALIAEERGAAL